MEWNCKSIIHVQTQDTLERLGSSICGSLRKIAPISESSIDLSVIQRSPLELLRGVLRQDLSG
jgi:hypothetical protein